MVDNEDVRGGTPAVVGTLVIGDRRIFASLFQHLLQWNEDVTADVRIEVTGEIDGSLLVLDNTLDAIGDELHRLATGHLTHMVKMRVETIDVLTCLFVLEIAPRHDAMAGGVPSAGADIRRLAQPEIAMLLHHKTILAIEDGHVLSAMFSVIATDTNIAVVRKVFIQIIQLHEIGLLHTEEVGPFHLHHGDGTILAVIPNVRTVIRRVQPDIVRDDRYGVLLGEDSATTEEKKQR